MQSVANFLVISDIRLPVRASPCKKPALDITYQNQHSWNANFYD
jgi:hypothetical protein